MNNMLQLTPTVHNYNINVILKLSFYIIIGEPLYLGESYPYKCRTAIKEL